MKVAVVFVLLVAVCAASKYSKEESAEHEVRYDFEWSVNDEESKLDFGHKESRDNDQTSGVYKVLLPDGVVQIVTYSVDGDNGYVANVENTGGDSGESQEAKKY